MFCYKIGNSSEKNTNLGLSVYNLLGKLIFQTDVENQATTVYNYVFDESANMYVPNSSVISTSSSTLIK